MNPRQAAPPPSPVNTSIAIAFFVALLIGAIWIFALEIVHRDREETISAAMDRNDNLAIAFEEYTTRAIESADDIIDYMIRDYQRSAGKFDINRFAADYTIHNKAITDVVLVDENAYIATTAYQGKPAKPVNVADREHFKVHLTHNSGKLFVGKPVIGRVSGKSVIPLTRRINKPDGSFGGVAIAMIEHSRFTDVLQDAKMRNLDIISLVGLDGITRARLRGTTPSTGEDISKGPLFAEMLRNPVGNYAALGAVDGVKRIFSYRSLPKYGLFAIVGTAELDVLATHYRRQQQYFWTAGVASFWIAGFALLLILSLEKQHRISASVARSQARFLATFNQAAVGIAHSDLDGVCLDVNQRLCDIIGYQRDELLGRKFTALTHPDDVAASNDFRKQVIQKPDEITALQREKRYIHKNGSIVWCLLTTTVVRNEAGDIDYLAAIIQDISALKATEQALRVLEQEQRQLAIMAEAERARLAEAQAVAQIGSWETKFPELTVTWSAETYRIFEVDTGRFQPTHAAFLEFIHPDDRAKVDAAFSSSLADSSPRSIEHRIVMSHGRIKTVEERWRTFFDEQGQPARVAGTCQDITDKKKAEQDRAQLAAIVESSSDAIVSRSLDGVIVSWNQAAERMFGWTAAEAIGRPPQIMTPPDYLGKFTTVIERVKRGEITAPFETVRVRKNGVRFDAQVCLSAVKDNSGQVIGIATIVRDITDRKRAEQAQAQLAAIVESSNDAIISSLPETKKILSWNRAAERMFGWSAEEAIGQSVRIIAPPEFIGRLDPLIRQTMQGETVAPLEVWRQRKDGSRFEAQISFSYVRGQDGKISAIATIVRDITDRREKEAIALKEKMFSDAMIESMPGIVYFYNEQGRFLRWNRNFSRVSGYSPEEIATMHPLDFFRKEEKPLLERKIREVFVRGDASVEADFLAKDGRATQYYFTGKRVMFDGTACLVGMGIDIHERKLAEAAIRDYAAQMRHLSWRLSEVEERERRAIHRELHDQVGANLAALKLDLGLINSMLSADDRKTVGDRLQKAQLLTGETVAQIRDVMGNLRPPALDDYGLLAALRNYAQPYSARLGIPVMVDGDDIQPRLAIAVETALFRIVQEALNNIAKHAQARHIGITVSTTDNSVTLVVADDGTGFDADRVDPHHAAWGLRTMRERAQAIAADFRIESSPGNGTRIIVELPRDTT